MSRLTHVFKELSKNITRSPGSTFSALLSMIFLLLLFDLFWIAARTSEGFYSSFLSELNMEVFVAEETPDSVLATLEASISGVEGVSGVNYISRETARDQLTQLIGLDLLVGYDNINPLPRSYVLSFTPDYISADRLAGIERRITTQTGVSHVYYSRNWLEKAETTRGIIQNIGLMLGMLLLITVLINSANNMRLTARTRAAGLQQMQLLGAGKLFLSAPFMLEGLLIGGLAAALGWLTLFYWKDKIQFTQIEIMLPATSDIIIYCALSALLGLVSGHLGVRKMLRY